MSTTTLEAAPSVSRAGKYLTFILGNESYGIAVTKIREIIRLTDITSVPQMPHYVKGVINLRGKIIPVVDLRQRFAMPSVEATERSCIIVVQAGLRAEALQATGLVVDDVEEVINLAPTDIEDTPDFGAQVDVTYLLGMAKVKGVVKTLLDIDRVLLAS